MIMHMPHYSLCLLISCHFQSWISEFEKYIRVLTIDVVSEGARDQSFIHLFSNLFGILNAIFFYRETPYCSNKEVHPPGHVHCWCLHFKIIAL